MMSPDPRTTPAVPIQEIPALNESTVAISAERLITESISITTASRGQLSTLIKAMDLPIGDEIISEILRAIREPRSEFDTTVLRDEQVTGCFTRMRDRRLHAVGEGSYMPRRQITLTPTASNLSFVSVTLSADEKDKSALAINISFDLPALAPDQRAVVPEFVQSVFSVLGFTSLPAQPNVTLDAKRLAEAETPSFHAQLSPQCSAMYVINEQETEAVEDETQDAHVDEGSVFSCHQTYGIGFQDPTIKELHQITTDAGLSYLADFDGGKGDESFFAKTLDALRDNSTFEHDIWEMFNLPKAVLIQSDTYFDIGTSADGDAADTSYQAQMEIDGPYISFTGMSIEESTSIVELSLEELKEDLESDETRADEKNLTEETDPAEESNWKDVTNSPLTRSVVSARLIWHAELSNEDRWEQTLRYLSQYADADREVVEDILKYRENSGAVTFDRIEVLFEEPLDRSLI